jgi:DHA2 family metal-tetracycline-proton antiporter-like MFS transporter
MPANENSKDALIIFSVALATFMGRLDSYIVNVSLPTMARYFDSSLSDISRVVFIYVLAMSSTLLLFGKLADRTGLKRLFLWGYFLFTAGSLVCGVSTGIHMLIVSRFVQEWGARCCPRHPLLSCRDTFPRKKPGWPSGSSPRQAPCASLLERLWADS